MNFLTIYCRSPGGDTAAALSRMAFYTIYIQSPWGDSATALAEFALREWGAVHGALMLAVFLQCLQSTASARRLLSAAVCCCACTCVSVSWYIYDIDEKLMLIAREGTTY